MSVPAVVFAGNRCAHVPFPLSAWEQRVDGTRPRLVPAEVSACAVPPKYPTAKAMGGPEERRSSLTPDNWSWPDVGTDLLKRLSFSFLSNAGCRSSQGVSSLSQADPGNRQSTTTLQGFSAHRKAEAGPMNEPPGNRRPSSSPPVPRAAAHCFREREGYGAIQERSISNHPQARLLRSDMQAWSIATK